MTAPRRVGRNMVGQLVPEGWIPHGIVNIRGHEDADVRGTSETPPLLPGPPPRHSVRTGARSLVA